jgi:hypothetical protein
MNNDPFVAGISDLMLIQGRLLLYEDSCMRVGVDHRRRLYLCPGYLCHPCQFFGYFCLIHYMEHLPYSMAKCQSIIYMIVIPYYNLSGSFHTNNYIVSRNVEFF